MTNSINTNNKLGKGLSSLLGERRGVISENIHSDNIIQQINISSIVANKYQPRVVFKKEELVELSESIKNNGLLQPITVRKLDNDKYELLAGERRMRACRILEMKTIPAIVKDYSNKEMMTLSIVENVQRSDISSIEEGMSYKKLIEEFNYTQNEVAELVGKSRSHISNLMRLLLLPTSVQDMLMKGELETGHARALIGSTMAEEIAKYIKNKKLSVREVEKLVKSETLQEDIQSKKEIKSDFREIENNIKDSLLKKQIKASVSVNKKNPQAGKIVINYKNIEELENIISNL